ncbi:SAG1386/EF1546 family surface-associated protein [Limosilactobacillus sp.]|uniref:SAG1386/EF1546 family surface-associated protein n=1 Tax=Limosilactobacillus sp. TaxID=2773925 RepID=UPI00345E20A3
MSERREDQHHDGDKLWDKTFTDDPDMGQDGHLSRTEHRKRDSHNSMITTVLVLIIIILAAAPVIFWVHHQQSFNHPVRSERVARSKSTSSRASKSKQPKHKTQTKSSKERKHHSSQESNANVSSQSVSSSTMSSSSSTSSRSNSQYATVESGQGIYRVAVNNGLTVQELARLNNISPSTPLHPGQRLRVK